MMGIDDLLKSLFQDVADAGKSVVQTPGEMIQQSLAGVLPNASAQGGGGGGFPLGLGGPSPAPQQQAAPPLPVRPVDVPETGVGRFATPEIGQVTMVDPQSPSPATAPAVPPQAAPAPAAAPAARRPAGIPNIGAPPGNALLDFATGYRNGGLIGALGMAMAGPEQRQHQQQIMANTARVLMQRDPSLEPEMAAAIVGNPAILKSYMSKGVGGTKFGKTGAIFQGPQGGFYSIQFGEDGTKKIEPVTIDGKALRPAKGVTKVGDALVDQATGTEVRNVGENITGAEIAKGKGVQIAELKKTIPKARAALRSIETSHKNVVQTIDQALTKVDGWTSGLPGQLLSNIGGTAATDLATTLDTIQANLAFDKLQDMRANSPTGGALGAVSERELALLQSTIVSVKQSQTGEQLKANLARLKEVLAQMQKDRRQAFDETYAPIMEQSIYSGLPSVSGAGGQAPLADPLGIRGK